MSLNPNDNSAWYAFTPSGMLCTNTRSMSRDYCIRKLPDRFPGLHGQTWTQLRAVGWSVKMVSEEIIK